MTVEIVCGYYYYFILFFAELWGEVGINTFLHSDPAKPGQLHFVPLTVMPLM